MSNKLIGNMVDRFLSWKLPKGFCPDAGISFNPKYPYEDDKLGNSWWHVGTNLFDAIQTREMIEYILGDSLAEIAALHARCEEQEKVIAILELKNKGTLANNLCPDCRDKQVGKPCLACTIQSQEKVIESARETLSGIANANWKTWAELSSPAEFVRWAKSRANHALAAMKEKT